MRVIRIFKSRLFQALLDVQEFYELTLMDETKSTDVKKAEALHMALCWEIAGPPGGVRGFGDTGNIELGEKQKEQPLRNCCCCTARPTAAGPPPPPPRRPADCRPSPRQAPLLSRPWTPRPPWPWRPGPARWRGQ